MRIDRTAAYLNRQNRRRRQRVTISGTPVLVGTVGVAYAGFTVTGAQGTEPYTFAVAYGALPDGVTLHATTGVVSGTPTQAGSFSASIEVRDKLNNQTLLDAFTIVVT